MCAGRWVLTMSIERVIYPEVCHELGWPLRHWLGKHGVATHLAALLPCEPKCLRVEVNGKMQNLTHYFIPHPQAGVVTDIEEHRRRAAQ